MSGRDFNNDRACFDQCARRIVSALCQKSSGSKNTLVIIADTRSSDLLSSQESQITFTDTIRKFMSSLIADYGEVFTHLKICMLISCNKFNLQATIPNIAVEVLFADLDNEESVLSLKSKVDEVARSSEASVVSGQALAQSLATDWSKIASETPRPVYSPVRAQFAFVTIMLTFESYAGGASIAVRGGVGVHPGPGSNRCRGLGMAEPSGWIG